MSRRRCKLIKEPYKAREKVHHKMSREGLTLKNAVTGEQKNISQKLQDINLKPKLEQEVLTENRSTIKSSSNRQKQVRLAEEHNSSLQPDFSMEENEEFSDSSSADSQLKTTQQEPQRSSFNAERRPFDIDDGRGKSSKPKQHGTKYYKQFVEEKPLDSPDNSHTIPSKRVSESEQANDMSEKISPKLQFSKADTPIVPLDKKLSKLQSKVDVRTEKLNKSRKKLPRKLKPKVKRVFDEKKGKSKRKLMFEEQVKSKKEVLKGNPILRPTKAASSGAVNLAHGKLHEVEKENVGTEAAHKTERFTERSVRSLYRNHKLSPYRKVRKFEKNVVKSSADLAYQKVLRDNPNLKSNPISRIMQKRKLRKQYQKIARDSKKASKAVKTVGDSVSKVTAAVARFVKRHPLVFGVIGVLALLIIFLSSFLSSCSNLALGSLSSVVAASYTAEDADIDNAELIYTEWETDLQIEISQVEQAHAGYDEYCYSIGDIDHNPFELMAFLTAKYQDFTFSQVQPILLEIFEEQYQLSFTEEIEVRYRTETRTDSETGEDYDVEVAYDWYILNINLTSSSFSDVISSRLSADEQDMFGVYMETKGNRQYAISPFDFNWLPYVSDYYGYRIHPISGEKDYHKGIDISVPNGTDILAGHDGYVTFSGVSGGYGNVIIVEGENGLVTKYAHCSELVYSVGAEVLKGEVVAKVGNTGNSTGPHLHMEIIKNGQYLNPIYFAETNDDGSGALPGSSGGIPFPEYPGEPIGDGSYADLIAEAEKYLGFPYVWGGSNPSTSFDCSGFVCWVYTQSGAYNLPRTTATGIFNQCIPISKNDAKPGDLIFFHSTYSTPQPVSHVGIYVGNGMMIHCGNPISYTSINSNYWQEHFYAFGRLSD